METYYKESARYDSFDGYRSENMNFNDEVRINYALVGFFHPNTPGYPEQIKCAFCHVEMPKLIPGDENPLKIHGLNSSCEIMKLTSTKNIPLDADTLKLFVKKELSSTKDDLFKKRLARRRRILFRRYLFRILTKKRCIIILAKHPDYRKYTDRLKTFEEWPISMRQKPAELSKAGFFYSGKGDHVICFSCGILLKRWGEYEVPWEEHAIWYKNCHYLNAMKSAAYIKSANSKGFIKAVIRRCSRVLRALLN